MKILLRVISFLFFIGLIHQKAYSQSLYIHDYSYGFIAYSGYSNLTGPASSLMAGASYSLKRELDLSFEYSKVDSGIDGYWITQPEETHIYSGSLSLYPIKQWEGRPLTGQITASSGWLVNEYWSGPILSLSGGVSKRSNPSENLEIIPRVMLNYVPFVAQEYTKAYSLSKEFGMLVGFSSGISLLINPILVFDFDEQNSYAALVVGVVL